MMVKRYAMTEDFKTREKYGFQPVSLGDVSYEFFSIFWIVGRPALCDRLGIDMTADDDPLFLNFQGKREKWISHYVIQFFKHTIGLKINTTTIRALVEMEAKRLCREGLLTEHDRESIANVSGHSYISTVRDYYLLEDRDADRRRSAILFERLRQSRFGASVTTALSTQSGVSPVIQSEAPILSMERLEHEEHNHLLLPTEVEASVNIVPTNVFEGTAIRWGANHPHVTVVGARSIPWSEAEKDYIGMIVEEEKAARDGVIPQNICAIIRRRAHEDVNAHAIFHGHHTLDSARIRSGYEAYTRREDKRMKM